MTVEKLKGTEDYSTWKFLVRMLLIHEDLWDAVEQRKGPDDKTQRKALARICLLVHPSVLTHIRTAKTAYEAWDSLERAYEGKGLTRRLGLLRTLFALKLAAFDDMQSYLNKITDVGQQLHDIGAGLEDDFLAVIMLSGLSSDYDPLIMTLENSTEKLTTDTVRSRLTQEYQRRLENDTKAEALAVSKPKKTIRCFKCKQLNHKSSSCVVKVKPREKKDKSFFCAMSVNLGNEVFCVDSGATHNLTNNLKILHNYKEEAPVEIKVANGEKLLASGRGSVKISLQNTLRTISEVLYVPELTVNLLSVSAMTRKGFTVVFDKNVCKVFDGDQVVAVAKQVNGVYIIDKPCVLPLSKQSSASPSTCTATEQAVLASQSSESQVMWHRRLGHLNRRSMDLLKGMAVGIDYDNSNFKSCVPCIQGKQARLPFPKKSFNRAKDILGLVHTDLCGPMSKPSLSGCRYFLTFIDDYSRKTYIYFLRSKDQVFDKFREYKALVEKQTGKQIKVLRSDNGGEYINKNLQDFLKKYGIRHQTTVPHSPQQNGVAERANRTIVEKARCMLLDAGLDQRFWAEAVNTAVYLKNRSPTKAVRDTVPESKWSNKKVNMTHLRTFGCLAYALAEKRQKFDAKCEKYIFVGYCEETKGYRLIDPTNPKVCIKARNVTFLETEFYNSTIQQPPQTVEISLNSPSSNESVHTSQPVIPHDATGSPSNAGSDGVTIRSRRRVQRSPVSSDSIESDDPRDETYIPGETTMEQCDSEGSCYETSLALQSTCLASESCFDGEPETAKEALQSKDSEKWRNAMSDEYKSFVDNNCWTLCELPKGQKPVKCKWVFKRKRGLDGEVLRYKARLVAKGYTQKYGVNYFETFSPVVRYSTLRILLALAAEKNMDIDHLDVKTAFLNGDLKETIYMEQPEGFKSKENPHMVYRLNKAIYGLKQASKSWYEKINSVLIDKMKFRKFSSEPCVFIKNHDDGTVTIIALYVDDIILFTNNKKEKPKIKQHLKTQFEMKDLGPAHQILGMRLCKQNGVFTLDQSDYIGRVLERFNMSDCKPASTPMETGLKLIKCDSKPDNLPFRELIGCLMYIVVCTRPDIANAVSILSQFNDCFSETHWKAAKRVLRYLKGTINYCLTFSKTNTEINAFVDADWASNEVDRRSYTGFVFKLGGSTVSWQSRKQKTVALSSTEAEYMALSDACKEALFIRTFLYECLGIECKISIYNDSQSAQKLCCNPMFHARTKHIDVRHHFIRENVNKGIIKLCYVCTDDMVADILTKPLTKFKTEKFVSELGLNSKLCT